MNKAQTLAPYAGTYPKLAENVFVAPNATVIGDVKIGKSSSIWYGAVLRGDVNSISIGERTNVQDNVMVHVAKHNAAGKPLPTVIGNDVTIGHGATIHAATIDDCTVIGMGSTIMDGAHIQKGSVVAAGSLVVPGTVVKTGQVWAGTPAKLLRELAEGESAFIAQSAEDYAFLAAVHAEENAKSFAEIELDMARRFDRLTRDPDYDQQQGVERDQQTREIVNVAAST